MLRGTAKRMIVAHEIFRAFPAGFRKATSCINRTEWDEDTATWVRDYADPRELGEVHLGNQKMDYAPWGIFGYDGWMYISYLTQRRTPRIPAVTPGSICLLDAGGTGPVTVSGRGTLDAAGFATPTSASAQVFHDPTDDPDGWKYEVSAGTTPTAQMPITTTCDGVATAGNAAGQPVANRYTKDLRTFTGSIVNAGGFHTRDWAWSLAVSGGVNPPRP